MARYEFDVTVASSGETRNEAWLEAVNALGMDPGDAPDEYRELDDDVPIYGRSHEECGDCALELVMPQTCPGHPAGPVSCKFFKPEPEWFDVTIQRTEHREHVFTVEAGGHADAHCAAQAECRDYDWHDSPIKHADEVVDNVARRSE